MTCSNRSKILFYVYQSYDNKTIFGKTPVKYISEKKLLV